MYISLSLSIYIYISVNCKHQREGDHRARELAVGRGQDSAPGQHGVP